MNQLILVRSKQEVSNSLDHLFKEYEEKRSKILDISSFVKNKSDVLDYFLSGNKINHHYANTLFDSTGAVASLNAHYWNEVIKLTDVLSCMTADKRNEWNESIHLMKTPEFEKEAVISTIFHLLQNRDSFFADKVDGVFRKLSHTHVTNSPMGFKQRMIINHFLDRIGLLNHDRIEYVHDLRVVIAKIMKRDEPKHSLYSEFSSIIKREEFGQWFSFDGGAFKVRIYKKGTVHIEIAEEIAIELNSVLAQKYPQAIPEQNRKRGKEKKVKSFDLEMKLLSFDTCNALADISESVFKGNRFSIENKVSPDHLDELNEVLNYLNVDRSNEKYLIFNYDASSVLREISRMGALPDKKSHQFYPTSEYLVKLMLNRIHIDYFDKVLEPSAGLGGIAQFLPKKQTTCLEISPIHCSALKSMGFKDVVEMDFLKYNPTEKFDKILMNPPFTKNQAEDHLLHAISLLSAEGSLVAILPASYKGKTFDPNRTHDYSESFEGEFDGANVSVVILTLN